MDWRRWHRIQFIYMDFFSVGEVGELAWPVDLNCVYYDRWLRQQRTMGMSELMSRRFNGRNMNSNRCTLHRRCSHIQKVDKSIVGRIEKVTDRGQICWNQCEVDRSDARLSVKHEIVYGRFCLAGELISKKFPCKLWTIILLFFLRSFCHQHPCYIGPELVWTHWICVSAFVFASAVYLLSAKINCVTSSIFVFFVFIVVVVCSLSVFPIL